MALYAPGASLSVNTKTYTTQGEVPTTLPDGPSGYTAGGIALTGRQVALLSGGGASLDFADPTWPNATISARGALIYNFTKGNRAVLILDLGKTFNSTNGSFAVTRANPDEPLIRLVA